MRTCKIEGCDSKVQTKGYCNKHYMRLYRTGDPLHARIRIERNGMSKTPEYQVWVSMENRCYDKKHLKYPRYGGRGITVCERWRNSFTAFLEDMGKRPFPKAQIDRRDNDGNYEPGNCEWVSNKHNTRHTSTTKLNIQKAKEIRRKHNKAGVSGPSLAKEYNVSSSVIYAVLINRTWREA